MVFPHSRPLQRRRRKTRAHDFQQFPVLGSLDDKIVLFAPHGPSFYWRLLWLAGLSRGRVGDVREHDEFLTWVSRLCHTSPLCR